MINQISNTTIAGGKYNLPEKIMAKENGDKGGSKNDKVSLNEAVEKYNSYTKAGVLSVEPDSKYYQLGSIVSSLLAEQGMTLSDAINGKPYEVDEETQTEATELIAEDGYWGVEQTSERIFEFAINSAGNDTSKLEEIKAAIDNGFQMALDGFGGTLPDISYSTYDAVIEKLDSWANESKEGES